MKNSQLYQLGGMMALTLSFVPSSFIQRIFLIIMALMWFAFSLIFMHSENNMQNLKDEMYWQERKVQFNIWETNIDILKELKIMNNRRKSK